MSRRRRPVTTGAGNPFPWGLGTTGSAARVSIRYSQRRERRRVEVGTEPESAGVWLRPRWVRRHRLIAPRHFEATADVHRLNQGIPHDPWWGRRRAGQSWAGQRTSHSADPNSSAYDQEILSGRNVASFGRERVLRMRRLGSQPRHQKRFLSRRPFPCSRCFPSRDLACSRLALSWPPRRSDTLRPAPWVCRLRSSRCSGLWQLRPWVFGRCRRHHGQHQRLPARLRSWLRPPCLRRVRVSPWLHSRPALGSPSLPPVRSKGLLFARHRTTAPGQDDRVFRSCRLPVRRVAPIERLADAADLLGRLDACGDRGQPDRVPLPGVLGPPLDLGDLG